MYRKIIKGVLVSVSVVFFAVVVGYIAYSGAVSLISRSLSGSDTSSGAAQSVLSETEPEAAASPSPPESATYFLAKLGGDKIEIYSCDGTQNEQFLYSFSVYVPDIPEGDAEALRRGIRFGTKEDLLKFEEDFAN